jgi:hypothetical protein
VLRALPALVETVLELRALRTLLALLIAVGMAGTGKARREDEGLEVPYSGGKIWARAVWGRRSGSLFIRLVLADNFRLTAGFALGRGSGLSTVTWMDIGGSSGGEACTSSADTATSNFRLSNIVPRLAAVAGRPSLALSSMSESVIPCEKL